MAHYLEHLLANKGTRRLGTLDYEAEVGHLDRVRELYDELFDVTDPERRAEIYAQIDAESQAANAYTIANELKQAVLAAIEEREAALGSAALEDELALLPEPSAEVPRMRVEAPEDEVFEEELAAAVVSESDAARAGT